MAVHYGEDAPLTRRTTVDHHGKLEVVSHAMDKYEPFNEHNTPSHNHSESYEHQIRNGTTLYVSRAVSLMFGSFLREF
jgi:hypothetical protein